MKKPKDPEFQEWHKRSRVKQMVFHATVHEFHEFDTSKGDLGAHFGNLDQANNIVKNRLSSPPAGGPLIIPAWIRLVNPIRLKDTGSFHADGIALQIERIGLLPKGEGSKITKAIDADWRLRKQYDPFLLDILKNAGHDGVVYANTADFEGFGDSYIIFDSNQVIFSITNKFNGALTKKKVSMRPWLLVYAKRWRSNVSLRVNHDYT